MFRRHLLAVMYPAVIFSLLLAFSATTSAGDKKHDWQRITLKGPIVINDLNGGKRTLHPACSGGPECTIDSQSGQPVCHKGNTEFSFFIRKGRKDRLALFFDGGGACWDNTNCMIAPTYNAEIDETRGRLAETGGVLDPKNKNNPLRKWTQVFIPYCTGDIHWGSNDSTYFDVLGHLGTPYSPVTLHHRGFDNFLAVKDWLEKRTKLKNYYDEDDEDENEAESPFKEIFVGGASAGAYGAILAFPYVNKTWHEAKTYLLADAGNGVVTDNFMQAAVIGDQSRWGTEKNLPNWIPGYDQAFQLGADQLATYVFGLTSDYYPDSRIGQYTTAWDATQTGFLHVMQNINDPSVWQTPSPAVFCEWHARMRQYAYQTASAANYRFYIGAGLSHTISGSAERYNTEASAGVKFSHWLTAMLQSKDDDEKKQKLPWENAECTECGAPFDPSLCQIISTN